MTEDVPPGNKIVRAVEGGRIFLLFLPRGSRDFFLPTLHNTSVTLFNVTKRYVMNQLPPDFPRRYFSRKSVLRARHDCFKNNFARHEFIPRFKNHQNEDSLHRRFYKINLVTLQVAFLTRSTCIGNAFLFCRFKLSGSTGILLECEKRNIVQDISFIQRHE